METFGDRLRSEREGRKLSLATVAESLGVDQGRLLALERNDFGALPDEAAMTACLRAYAARLEVDADLMIEDYLRERERCLARLDSSVTSASSVVARRKPSAGRRAALVAAAVAGLSVGAWLILAGRGTTTSPEGPVATTTRTVPARAPAPIPQPPARAEAVEAPVDAPIAPTPAAGSLRVTDHGVGSAVRDRELVGRGERFSEGDQVSYFTRVEGGSRGERIEHVWLHEGVEVRRVELAIGNSSWRTHSAKVLHAGSAGDWAVEARDEAGNVLARAEFVCVP